MSSTMRSNRWLVWVYAGIACVLICSCARPKQTGADFSPVVDSVGKVVTGLLVQQDLARAKEVIDSADAAGWLTPYNAEMMRLRVLEREDANMPEVQQRYEKLLEQDLTPGQQAEVLEKLTYISRCRRNDENTLKYGMQYMDACRQAGNGVKEWSTQAEMGSVMVRLGRTEEGLAMIDEALQALDGVKQFAYMDACILAMKSYIRTLNDLNRYEEVIPVGERLVAKLQDFAAHPEVYDDGSVRMPNDARRPGYVDFYTGQAYAFIAYAYASMGQKDEARRYSRLFDTTKYSTTYNGRKQMASVWQMTGEYERMSAVYDEMAAAMGADSVNYDYAVMLFNRAMVAQKQGKGAQSANYWRRYAAMQKQLNEKERIAAAQEAAARYHEQERQYELEMERAKIEKERLIDIVLVALILLLSAFAAYITYQFFAIRRKDAILSREITDSINYRAKYLQLKRQPQMNAEKKDKESLPELAKMSDAELFEFLRVVIVNEQLFMDPLFDRKQLVDRFHLTKERVGAAFAQGSHYASLPEYVNECRLEHGAMLLISEPEMTIAEIAKASGFNSDTVFMRRFKERYTITPTEFRKKENKTTI